MAEGVDADLVPANRNRRRAGLVLLMLALVLGSLKTFSSPHSERMLLLCAAGVCLLIGIVLVMRALAERDLISVDREGSSKLFNSLNK